MRTILFIISTVISLSLLLLEDVVAQQRGWDLPPIPTPGKRDTPAPVAPESLDGVPEGSCDRKKNNSLACRYEVYSGRQSRLVQLASAEARLFGTWTMRTLVTMTSDKRPQEIAINPDTVPIRGLRWSATAVDSISDVPRRHRQSTTGRPYSIRDDGVTVDLYLSGEGVPELAFVCRMVRFSSSGDNLVCMYYESPAAKDDNFVPKGYVTFTREAVRRQPEIAHDPYMRRPPPPDDSYRRRSPFFW